MMTSTDLILVAGLWLPGRVWDPVVTELRRLGHRPVVPPLPGVDDGSTTVHLEDQLDAVLAAVDAARRPVVVGHSAASTLAWLAADRRPEHIVQTVLIGGFPGVDGDSYADLFSVVDDLMPFPGWVVFEGPDAADLDEAARHRFSHLAVPVPAKVAGATIRLTDERRFRVPVTLVCPEYTPDEARSWIDAGELPELARATDVSFVDLDSGHWPMLTRPVELARLLHDITRNARPSFGSRDNRHGVTNPGPVGESRADRLLARLRDGAR